MSRLEFNIRETEKDPFAFEVSDNRGHVIAEVRPRGWALRLLESFRDSKPPFLGAPDE